MREFFKSFSIISMLIYLIILLVFAALCSNPFVQILIYLCIIFLIYFADKKALKGSIIMSLIIGLPIMLINPLINDKGTIVLLKISDIPLWGIINITLEALIFSLSLTLKLITTVLIFSLFNLLINSDKLLNLTAFIAGKSTLIITLVSRLIPSLINQIKEIGEIQKTRGVNLDTKNLMQKVKVWYPFAKIILFSSLENSYNIAQAIESKAYGSNKRTIFLAEKIKPRDIGLIINSMLILVLIISGMYEGWLSYKFFPRLDMMVSSIQTIIEICIIVILVMFPVILAWGCRRCQYLK